MLLVTLLIVVSSYAWKHKCIHPGISSYIHTNYMETHAWLIWAYRWPDTYFCWQTLIFICTHTYANTCMSVHIYTYTFKWKHPCLYFWMSSHTRTFPHTYYIHTHLCIYAYIQTYRLYITCTYALIHTCVYEYIDTYIKNIYMLILIYT